MPEKDVDLASVFHGDTKSSPAPSVALDKDALIVQAGQAVEKYQYIIKLDKYQRDLVTLIMVGFAADVAKAAFAEVTVGVKAP